MLVFVRKIHHLGNARLDYSLCTFVAGEKTDLKGRAGKRLSSCVEDSVKLGVNDELILGFAAFFISVPREIIVGTAVWEAVVACR